MADPAKLAPLTDTDLPRDGAPVFRVVCNQGVILDNVAVRTLISEQPSIAGGSATPVKRMCLLNRAGGIFVETGKGSRSVIPFASIQTYDLSEPKADGKR